MTRQRAAVARAPAGRSFHASRLPCLELAVDAADLRRFEGLAVGGLREVPVKW